jgi:hypothetical protein
MKIFILIAVTCIIWARIPTAVAQNTGWIRINSLEKLAEIHSPAIAVISHTYIKDISLIQAEISRRNARLWLEHKTVVENLVSSAFPVSFVIAI